jgi:hypothetical protein
MISTSQLNPGLHDPQVIATDNASVLGTRVIESWLRVGKMK